MDPKLHILSDDEFKWLESKLEAELAALSPDKREEFERTVTKAGRAIESMNARLDETLACLDRSFRRLELVEALTEDATQVLGSREAAVSWLVCPHPRLGSRAPLNVLCEKDGVHRVRRILMKSIPRSL